jgi:hypothetical protein
LPPIRSSTSVTDADVLFRRDSFGLPRHGLAENQPSNSKPQSFASAMNRRGRSVLGVTVVISVAGWYLFDRTRTAPLLWPAGTGRFHRTG